MKFFTVNKLIVFTVLVVLGIILSALLYFTNPTLFSKFSKTTDNTSKLEINFEGKQAEIILKDIDLLTKDLLTTRDGVTSDLQVKIAPLLDPKDQHLAQVFNVNNQFAYGYNITDNSPNYIANIYYNPEYTQTLPVDELEYLLESTIIDAVLIIKAHNNKQAKLFSKETEDIRKNKVMYIEQYELVQINKS